MVIKQKMQVTDFAANLGSRLAGNLNQQHHVHVLRIDVKLLGSDRGHFYQPATYQGVA